MPINSAKKTLPLQFPLIWKATEPHPDNCKGRRNRTSKEDIANLFTRFYQGKHSLQGSGIGLSYAKQLVEMHGGIIGAQNNETKGATFFSPYRIDRKPPTFNPHLKPI